MIFLVSHFNTLGVMSRLLSSQSKQTRSLILALKRQLKSQNKTYRDLARFLDLSEASVKRLFSEQSFTLLRLEKTCNFLGLDFFELAALSVQGQVRTQALTYAQEQEIASDVPLLLVTLSVLNGFTFDDLLDYYAFSAPELVTMLSYLDRAKVIELLPENNLKLLVAPNFGWLNNGPIQGYFLTTAQKSFFNSTFSEPTEKLLVLNGVLSSSSNAKLQEKIELLYQEFNELMREDQEVPLAERSGNTLVLAIRQWQYPEFHKYIRKI